MWLKNKNDLGDHVVASSELFVDDVCSIDDGLERQQAETLDCEKLLGGGVVKMVAIVEVVVVNIVEVVVLEFLQKLTPGLMQVTLKIYKKQGAQPF